MTAFKLLIFSIWFASASFAQQEWRIGWTKAQFDSAFSRYLIVDPSRGQPPQDSVSIIISDFKVAGIKGIWLFADFINDTLRTTRWDAAVDTKQFKKLVKYLNGKFGKPFRVHENVDSRVAWVSKNKEIYVLEESELQAADRKKTIITLTTR